MIRQSVPPLAENDHRKNGKVWCIVCLQSCNTYGYPAFGLATDVHFFFCFLSFLFNKFQVV